MPRVSVVIPTYRRPALLTRCLAALAAQDLPAQEIEIIVVHDGPSEQVRRIVYDWRRRLYYNGGARLRFTNLPERRGPAAARNAGWRLATAAIIAFTDDDTVPTPTWLSTALRTLDDAAAASGSIVTPIDDDPTDYELDATGLERAEFVTANCFCRRAVLEELGGFDERFSRAWREDSDLHFRLLAAGRRIVQVPDAVVVHPIRPAHWGVSLSQQQKVQFDALLFKKHPALYRERIRRAPRWDYYLTAAALIVGLGALLGGNAAAAAIGVALWVVLTLRFCWARLRRTAKSASHVAEMIVTSAAIPLLAVFWRAVGAVRYRVMFL
jgi:glycosyltransferase involved in cell wall biosynthesis